MCCKFGWLVPFTLNALLVNYFFRTCVYGMYQSVGHPDEESTCWSDFYQQQLAWFQIELVTNFRFAAFARFWFCFVGLWRLGFHFRPTTELRHWKVFFSAGPKPGKSGMGSTRTGKWPKRIASVFAIFPEVRTSHSVSFIFRDWFPVLTDKLDVVGSSSSKYFPSPQFQTMTALFFLQRNHLHSRKTLYLSWNLGIECCQNRTP